jgi:hypothetical protein
MNTREYKQLEGMKLNFISGGVEKKPGERAIACTFTFDLILDFKHFKNAADKYVPGYLESPINAIRPELQGLAYHISYDYFADQAGKIDSNEALFRIFARPDSYLNGWSSGELRLERRYQKPVFQILDGKLRIDAGLDFRWEDPKRIMKLLDLPIIEFQWALNVMEGHLRDDRADSSVDAERAPSSVVVFMYTSEDRVEVDGVQMFRGTRYIRGSKLSVGPIEPEQILTVQ